jgi:hypothetical protein
MHSLYIVANFQFPCANFIKVLSFSMYFYPHVHVSFFRTPPLREPQADAVESLTDGDELRNIAAPACTDLYIIWAVLAQL